MPDGSYSISNIQDYFDYILKRHVGETVNPPIRRYINEIENRITFKIKTVYYLELLTPETMKLLGSNKSKITKNENGENVPYLEIIGVVLIHCHVVNNIVIISCSTCCLVGPVKATWICASFDSNLVIISCSTCCLIVINKI